MISKRIALGVGIGLIVMLLVPVAVGADRRGKKSKAKDCNTACQERREQREGENVDTEVTPRKGPGEIWVGSPECSAPEISSFM